MAKGNKKQTLAVLLLSMLLLTLCTGGLWAYVKNADAETGVQETAATELPKEDEISVTWEKYDNFPPTGKEDDLEQRFIGTGLTQEEKRRLPALIEAYTNKKGPALRFPARSLPDVDGLAIVPLDPTDYAGMTEYYILPAESLDDQQMMQLIDYSANKGETFTADTLSSKNCMRGGYSLSNRYLSAGEDERHEILIDRICMDGLWPDSPELSIYKMPVKGMVSIHLRPDKHNGKDAFHLYPIREMTDDELLQSANLDFTEGYTYLKPAEDESLNPAKDAANTRAILEEFMGMPKAAENYMLSYKRKDATGEIRLQCNFRTAEINGIRTYYFAMMDLETGRYLSLNQFAQTKTTDIVNAFKSQIQKEKGLPDSEILDIAGKLVERVTDTKILDIRLAGVSTDDPGDEYTLVQPAMTVQADLEDGSHYLVQVHVSDGVVETMRYFLDDYEALYDW